MAGSVHNPATPYVGPVQGGVYDGLQIHVVGVAEHHHNGFLISLQTGASIDPRCDCAFVFNPRFSESQVVRNSLQNGSWGAEERHGGFPFHRGQRCEVTIAVTEHQYKVSVNGRHFCDYNHRIPKHRVTHISVEQGIKIQTIRFQGGHHHHGGIGAALGKFAGAMFNEMTKPPQHHQHHQHHPPPPQNCPQYPSSGAMPGYPGQPSQPVYNPPVPFVHNVGGLYPNKMIIISGIPNPNPSRFNVNFECRNGDNAFHFDARFNFGSDRNVIVRNTKQHNSWGGEERFTMYLQHGHHHEPNLIALCFDARFNFGADRNAVVRNSKQHADWGAEERHIGYFPFIPNANFDMIIMVEPRCFKVAVNNQHLLEFNHRIQQLNRIDTLRIDGDLRLTQVKFQ